MSIYRNTVWFVKGLREYTRGGYEKASRDFVPGDLDVDCKGKNYIITGANSGIGKACAMAIAQRGGSIHMVCRSKARADEVRDEIVKETNNHEVYVHEVDMSKPSEIYRFGRTYQHSGKQLDVLINNAGCMVNTRTMTEENLEVNFATNTLGTHIITRVMLPCLRKATNPRVIIVTSGGMLTQKLDADDLQFRRMRPFDGTMAYAQNKRQQVHMTEHYAVQYPDIKFFLMHPGWADTPAVQSSMPGFYEKMKNRLRSPEQGADTLVWLAIAESVNQCNSGDYFQDRKSVSKHLTLALTRPNERDVAKLMQTLDEYADGFDKPTE